MTFVPLNRNGGFEARAFADGSGYFALARVGYEHADAFDYDLMVQLCLPDATATEDWPEYSFLIVKRHRTTGDYRAIFDSAESNAFIPKAHRRRIRSWLLTMTENVLLASNCDAFFMVTFCDNLPPVALEKYEALCQLFRRHGYNVTQTEPVTGKYHWFVGRRRPSAKGIPAMR